MVALPASGRVSPTMIRRVVDFPAPFGPRKPVTRPGEAVKLTSSTARVVPYRLLSLSMVIMCQLADFGLMSGVRVGRMPMGGSAGGGEPDRFGADLPETGGHGLVVAARGGPRGCAADEIAATHLRQLRGRGHMNRGDRAPGCRLHERPQQRDEYSLSARGVVGAEAGAHDAGVQGVGGDGHAVQPPGQLVAEQDVGQLGLVVGPRAGVAA